MRCERNAFGRQVRSFETELEPPGIGTLGAVFISAPWVAEHNDGVEVLAEVEGHPVAVRSGEVLAIAFHPELSGEPAVHAWLVERARGYAPAR